MYGRFWTYLGLAPLSISEILKPQVIFPFTGEMAPKSTLAPSTVNVKQKVDHRDHQKIDHLGIKLFTQMGG